MNFSDKLDKVFKVSKLVSNVNQLEKRIGVSTGTILKPYNDRKPPGLGTVKKIIDYLGINQEWWDTGKGDMFIKQPSVNSEDHSEETQPPTLLQILRESLSNVNKLVDANNGLVDKLDKDKNWAFTELEKLHAKFGISKEP